jgi:hypothetical protein
MGYVTSLNQAAGYIGKHVTLLAVKDDKPYEVTGLVTSVTLKGGEAHVILDGDDNASYAVSTILDVRDKPAEKPIDYDDFVNEYVEVELHTGVGDATYKLEGQLTSILFNSKGEECFSLNGDESNLYRLEDIVNIKIL